MRKTIKLGLKVYKLHRIKLMDISRIFKDDLLILEGKRKNKKSIFTGFICYSRLRFRV